MKVKGSEFRVEGFGDQDIRSRASGLGLGFRIHIYGII
jgi:hypothetical protein